MRGGLQTLCPSGASALFMNAQPKQLSQQKKPSQKGSNQGYHRISLPNGINANFAIFTH